MALISMTGFSRVTATQEGMTWVIEARSVNSRNLDIKVKFPNGFDFFELIVKEICKSHLSRGQVTANLILTRATESNNTSINREVLRQYLAIAQELTDSGQTLTPSADGILSLKGVIEVYNFAEDSISDALQDAIQKSVYDVIAALKETRQVEGKALTDVISGQMTCLMALITMAESLANQQTNIIRERFVKRLNDLAVDTALIEDRFFQEISILITKADVKEELDRMKAHIEHVNQLIHNGTSQGRKLDFLAQEFMREANTLCSKSAFTALTQVGLEIKTIIDQFREQCQNVE